MTEVVPLDDLSVIIPAYNEEKRLISTIEKTFDFLNKRAKNFEIIVVDDGSTDNTIFVVENLTRRYSNLKLLKNGVNRGKGFSVRHGVKESKGSYCIFTDADNSSPIENILKFVSYINENTLIIGSRRLQESIIESYQPCFRKFLGKCFSLLIKTFLFSGIRDTQCGFKMFSRKIATEVFPKLTIDGFAFDVELLYLCKKMGFKVVEVPIIWKNDERSTVRPVRDSIGMFFEILKVRYRHAKKVKSQK